MDQHVQECGDVDTKNTILSQPDEARKNTSLAKFVVRFIE